MKRSLGFDEILTIRRALECYAMEIEHTEESKAAVALEQEFKDADDVILITDEE